MIILPAIDIIDGKPVRLFQGDYAKKEVVASSVLETARSFEEAGAEFVHLVDLDGARAGSGQNRDLIVQTAQSLSVPVEVGGGIRTMETIRDYLENGVERVILGTAALENPDLLEEALQAYGERIAVGLDCRQGKVSVSGWLNDSDADYLEFAEKMEKMGVKTIIFTDISRDGTLSGPNLEMLQALQQRVGLQIIASGGIKDLEHIGQLADLDLYGAITGKAMYAGTLDLVQAIERGKKSC